MEDAFICRIATLTDMERKWEYEIARHGDQCGVLREEALRGLCRERL